MCLEIFKKRSDISILVAFSSGNFCSSVGVEGENRKNRNVRRTFNCEWFLANFHIELECFAVHSRRLKRGVQIPRVFLNLIRRVHCVSPPSLLCLQLCLHECLRHWWCRKRTKVCVPHAKSLWEQWILRKSDEWSEKPLRGPDTPFKTKRLSRPRARPPAAWFHITSATKKERNNTFAVHYAIQCSYFS